MMTSMRAGRGAALLLCMAGCGGEPPLPKPEPPLVATAAHEPSPPVAAAPAVPCRWQGYGIGGTAGRQCSRSHLSAHAAVTCFGLGGMPGELRFVNGSCGDEAEEVQARCCFAEALPAPDAMPTAAPGVALDRAISAAPGGEPRDRLLSRAEAACAGRLGDWTAAYAGDGAALAIRFACP